MTEYVHVGRHADILSSCRHLAPGDRVSDADLGDEDRWLIDEGRLVDTASFGDGPSNAAQIHRDEPPAPAAPSTPSVRPAAVTAPTITSEQEGNSDERDS